MYLTTKFLLQKIQKLIENYNSQQRKKNNFVKKIVNILLMREDNKPRA